MEIYYPLYYKDFHCLADKCKNSCCVGWEICVDEQTLKKYSSLAEPQRSEICKNIHNGSIELTDDGRCPFLDKNGLCKIISTLGEDYISEICREHPRFYNRILDRNECGVGASCPEACRLILTQNDYRLFTKCSVKAEKSGEQTDFDTLKYRDIAYSVLSDSNASYADRIKEIKNRFQIPDISDERKNALIDELEYLNESHKGGLLVGKRASSQNEIYCERFLAYLIFRHVSVAKNYKNLCARLGFCLMLCEILENFCAMETNFDEIKDFARIISEEIEYSEDNCDLLIFEFECELD